MTAITMSDKTIGFYIARFLKEKSLDSKNTAQNYASALRMMAKEVFNKELIDLTKEDIETFTHDKITEYKYFLLENGSSNNTVNSRLFAITSTIRNLKANKAIDYDIGDLDLVKTLFNDKIATECIPEDTLMEYVEYFEASERKGLEKKWASLLLLETANRAEEIVSIRKDQFVKDGDTYILKSKGKNVGKGNKEYYERIGSEMYDELMLLNPDSEKVFSISYKALYGAFVRANEAFGNVMIKYTPHSIKHLALLLEWNVTKDILAVQRKGKHSSIETTRGYLKVFEVVIVGAYTRRKNTNLDLYKHVENEKLIEAISDLPLDVRVLINQKLEMNKLK